MVLPVGYPLYAATLENEMAVAAIVVRVEARSNCQWAEGNDAPQRPSTLVKVHHHPFAISAGTVKREPLRNVVSADEDGATMGQAVRDLIGVVNSSDDSPSAVG